MRVRIAIWALAGALIVLSWSLCFMAAPDLMAMPGATRSILWGLLNLTIPVSVLRHSPHPVGMYSVLLVNAATYALIGMLLEALRGYIRRSAQTSVFTSRTTAPTARR